MIQDDGFTCESIPVKSITNVDFEQPEKFEWPVKNNEKAKKNTDAYLAYVQDFFEPFFKLAVRKSIEDPALNTTVGKNPRHLKGNADLYVTPASCLTICRNQLCMVFELKPNEITPKNLAQAIGYVIAANSLFDARGRPSPVGVLTDLADQWRLIWVGKEGQICYAETEELPNGKPQPLTRETALYYIRKYIEDYHNLLVQESKSGKRHAEDEVHWAYGELESGRLKKVRIDVEDNMLDVLETPEEIALYEMRKRMMMTPLFDIPPAAEHMSYFG
ncbi:hypothetical protein EDD86DRAFT_198578 [Gorgonomyces haynaldii]|nr:hypothetical protein EDD86DRAFT_206472 [Gorgonomyces haynaldii]KAI8914142.1 hypothetical protein EDD86DRAFT_198578 [Gorgonomyces haynaldii]